MTGVGVEKLFPAKFAKIKSRQDALQTTFSVFLDIFYPPFFGYFEENGLFQHPQAIATQNPFMLRPSPPRIWHKNGSTSACPPDFRQEPF
jgi:hypothetical protein